MRPRRANMAREARFPQLGPQRPAPTYPQYQQLVADAKASVSRDNGFVDPAKSRASRQMGRGHDWQIAVLGHDGSTTLVEMHMLLLAHERNLDPPLPQWVVDARAEATRVQAARDAARQLREDADQAVWDEIRVKIPVEFEVLRNGHARPRFGHAHHLGHVVPKVDVRSAQRRRHRAGRALCETENRPRPLDLSGGSVGPATCVSCLAYAQQIRPAAV